MKAKIKSIADEFPKKVGGAMYRILDKKVMTRAKEEFVPSDQATLKDTGITSLPIYEGKNIIVELSFGGPAAPYALTVHEHPSKHDPASWRAAMKAGKQIQFKPLGHGPGYLIKPLLEEAETFLADVVADIRL